MSRITCDVSKDIMPLYIDGICSEYSKQLIEEHIKDCESCKKIRDSYSNSSITDKIKENNEKAFKDLALQVKKKNRRKIIFITLGAVCASVILMICFGLIILGIFSLGAKEDYKTIEISNYGKYEGHIEGEKQELWSGLYVFPKEISRAARDISFFYSCNGGSFDSEYQQFLKCTYPDEEFKAEVDRLRNIKCEIDTKKGTVVNPIEYSTSKFNHHAYIAAYGSHDMYEYAICNEDAKTITYVYLQLISNKEVAFSEEYLPIEYQNGKPLLDDNARDNTNIYYSYIGNGVYMNFKD